jgi:hypothetical protein
MSSNHENHSAEVKEVSFTTPLILGLVTVLVILAFVSIGDNKHHGCEAKNAHGHEQPSHAEHAAAPATEAGHAEEAHH